MIRNLVPEWMQEFKRIASNIEKDLCKLQEQQRIDRERYQKESKKMAKEMKQKKEVKKPKKMKHDDKAEDMKMMKSKMKKDCFK